MIKAIDTFYSDHYFRSRLEARWAVYFTEMGLFWEYEKEGFELGDGERYLPDFYFPDYKFYAEIKPEPLTETEHLKCFKLAQLTGLNVIELVGLPSVQPMDINVAYKSSSCSKCGHSEYYDWGNVLIKCDCNAEIASVIKVEVLDAILLPYSPKESYKPLYFSTYMDDYTNDPIIAKAIIKAKCARFEFNEKGN